MKRNFIHQMTRAELTDGFISLVQNRSQVMHSLLLDLKRRVFPKSAFNVEAPHGAESGYKHPAQYPPLTPTHHTHTHTHTHTRTTTKKTRTHTHHTERETTPTHTQTTPMLNNSNPLPLNDNVCVCPCVLGMTLTSDIKI